MADALIPCAPSDLAAALEASGFVGSWMHDLWEGQLTLAAPFARLLGIDPERAAEGVPVALFFWSACIPTTAPGSRIIYTSLGSPVGRSRRSSERRMRAMGCAAC